MTDSQIVQLVRESVNTCNDLMLAYVAQTEIRVQALENILRKKHHIASREDLLNEQIAIGKKSFDDYVLGLDSLLRKNLLHMRRIRSKRNKG